MAILRHRAPSTRSRLRVGLATVALVSVACGGGPQGTPSTGTGPSTTASPTTQVTTAPTTIPTTTTPATTSPTTQATTTTTLAPLEGLALETLADGLDRPVYARARPGESTIVVVERTARIRTIDANGDVGVLADLRPVVGSVGIEQGLLGFAFHPHDPTRTFVYFTDKAGDSVLAELTVPDDLRPETPIGPEALRTILTVEQPTDRHNAGMVEFGPDGMLYVALGEGGAARRHAQDPHTLLSAILRIDVDGGDPYAIPEDNPFVDGGGAPEVWAYGLRNPWRFAIDAPTELVYIADVGHADVEEVDVVPLRPGGWNLGWPLFEGTRCFFSDTCDPSGTVLPVYEYTHDEGCSITGGFVYRGRAIPELDGHYMFGDWCTGLMRSFLYEDGAVGEVRDWTEDLPVGQPTSFGLDGDGELLVTTWAGEVFRIVPVRGR